MGTLRSNKAVGDLQGMVGGLVYVHRADGVVIVRRAPEYKEEETGEKTAEQSRFAKAQLYVKCLKATPEKYAPYKLAAKIARKRACDLGMSDFLTLPEIGDVEMSSYIGQVGNPIRVRATDDFQVASVALALTRADGAIIEQGPGALDQGSLLWIYLTQTAVIPGEAVIVHVTVLDLPGNAVTKTLHHLVGSA